MPPTRRNLFQSHLSRRPAQNTLQDSAAPSETNTSSSSKHDRTNLVANDSQKSTTSHNNKRSMNQHCDPRSPDFPDVAISATGATDSLINNGEIITRDKNGKVQLDIPILPPVPLDEDDEQNDLEDEDEGAMEGIEEDGSRPGAGPKAFVGEGKDNLENDLVEMMFRNRNRHLSGEPELLNLLQQSLRNKVATLEEDNWMFDPEREPLA